MASSQVEVASSAPFGRVLRDHTRRNGCRDSNPKGAQDDTLQKNFKHLVRDHLNSHDFDHEHHHCQPADSWSASREEEHQGHQAAVSTPSHASSMSACFNDISELGASSLVQIWEKRLTRSNSNKTNSGSPTSTSSTGACVQEEDNMASETEERGNEHQGDGNSDHQSSHSTQSEAEKLERVRVAEIIRRLSCASEESNNELEQSFPCALDHQQAEQRMFTPLLRLRGRQAFNDLIMQMERDRNGELEVVSKRAAVSKFTHKGRIQAMLRLKLLHRGVPYYDPPYQHPSRASCVKKLPHGQMCSTITHIRERFNAGNDHGNKVQRIESESTNKKKSAGESRNIPTESKNYGGDDSQREGNASISTESKADTVKEALSRNRVLDHHKSVENNVPTSVTPLVDLCNATRGTKVEANVGTSIDLPENSKATPNEAIPSTDGCDSNGGTYIEQEVCGRTSDQYAESNYHEMPEEIKKSLGTTIDLPENAKATPSTDGCDGNDGTYTEQEFYGRTSHQNAESNYDEMTDEIEESYGYDGETSYSDWISHISRPRSFWESRRQEWYREMLTACSDNDQDKRQLIERRTVSNFLSSDLREKMDRLMVCHFGRQSIMMENDEDGLRNSESMEQFTKFLHKYSPSAVHDGREDGAEYEEQEEREDEEHKHGVESSLSSSQGHHHYINDDFDQSISSPQVPSLVRSWSYKDNDTGDDSDRHSPQHCQTFYDNSPQNSPSNNHNSVEMELIYDLRVQMEQLHREMAELRKSIKSSMDLQTSFKNSLNPEAHSVKREAKDGSCRVCHEMKVDTVFYRCGHMCACLKCANELQWSSGKCPVCRAAIVDVIRVHVDDDA